MRPDISTALVSRAPRVLRLLVTVSTVAALTAVVGVAVAASSTPPAPRSSAGTAQAAPLGRAPGTYHGPAFDACTAPSDKQMKAWLKSPYRGIVVYIGGSSRGCKQPNLTATWVKTQQAAGWHLIPLYVGPQAACSTSTSKYRISLTAPEADARKAADDAVAQAKKLGLGRDSVLTYNMESYRTTDDTCTASVLTFLSAWTARLHDLGYLSGFYGDMWSGVRQVVAAYHRAGFVRPDYVDFARWDGVATVTDIDIPADFWAPHRRMKQYRGPHKETWGGVTINIDNDHVDVAPLPATRIGDITANGWSDLITVTPMMGTVAVHAGNGTTLTRRTTMTRFAKVDAVTRHGDFNRDGRDDVIARDKSTGHLWLYPGNGSDFGAGLQIGTGWNGRREITAVGDLTADGYADVVAVDTATGALVLYPGRGNGLRAGITLEASGWQALDQLTGVGDVDGNGTNDLIARVKATGTLRLYPGVAGRFGAPREIGSSAGGLRNLTGVGDFDRDGTADVMATDATGTLYRYPVGPTSLGAPVVVGSGMVSLLVW